MNKSETIDYIKNRIKTFPEYYPIIAVKWKIESLQKDKMLFVKHTTFKTISNLPIPFNKPISKMINIQNLK